MKSNKALTIFATTIALSLSLITEISLQKPLNPTTSIEQFENGLRHKIQMYDGNHAMNIADRMAYYNVSGISIAVIDKGEIAWSKTYGNKSTNASSPSLDTNTLFQAGSISKSITAFGVLKLVQEKKISLDEDVNTYLKRWKVPENSFTSKEKVTLRRLLSHTSGTTVTSFPGYLVQDEIPNTVEILEGKHPLVNTAPVRVTSVPGSEYRYSGGGTTIIQLLIEDVTGEPFEVWMQRNVLDPLEMSNSTFSQSVIAKSKNVAIAHNNLGKPVKGNKHIYPEMAAAGLWSTPSDLAKFILHIQTGLQEGASEILDPSLIHAMVTRQKIENKETNAGLGFFLQGKEDKTVFGHDGSTEGFITRISALVHQGQGFIIMINSDLHASELLNELTHSIQDSYHWPGTQSIWKNKVHLNPSILHRCLGTFSIGEKSYEITLSEGKLYIDLGAGKWELHPASEHRFFVEQMDIEIEFDKHLQSAASFMIYQNGKLEGIFLRNHS